MGIGEKVSRRNARLFREDIYMLLLLRPETIHAPVAHGGVGNLAAFGYSVNASSG